MTKTIDYDKHVKNLIAELNATKHVTHSKHKKTSVTFHHNGGVGLSHEAVLGIWTKRPASAHFDVDKRGDVAQYVEADEYAWAVGNTEGNKVTISIELANSTATPHWLVSKVTWSSGARLAAWLFVHEIKERPTRHNVFLHDHWSATSCPGPFIHSIYEDLLNEVQRWYKLFTEDHDAGPKDRHPTVEDDIKMIQVAVGIKADGWWGKETDHAVLAFRKKHLHTNP